MLNFYFLLTFQSCSITKERQREKRDKIENVQMKVTCWSCCCCCHYQILLLASCGATIGNIQLVAKLASEVFVPCNIYCMVFVVFCYYRLPLWLAVSPDMTFKCLRRCRHFINSNVCRTICYFFGSIFFVRFVFSECNFHGLLQLFDKDFPKKTMKL